MATNVCFQGYDFVARALAARDALLHSTTRSAAALSDIDSALVPPSETLNESRNCSDAIGIDIPKRTPGSRGHRSDLSSISAKIFGTSFGSTDDAHVGGELLASYVEGKTDTPATSHSDSKSYDTAANALKRAVDAPDSPQVLTVTSQMDMLEGTGFRTIADALIAHDNSERRLLQSNVNASNSNIDTTALPGAPSFDSVVFSTGGSAPHITTARIEIDLDGEHFVMPAHFGIVEPGIYRTAFPSPDSYPFLARIGIRTIINLLDRLPTEYNDFMECHGIKYHHLAVKGNKVHCEEMDRNKVLEALRIMMDVRNHPVLIHCRSGKHRTGAVIGCLRMLQHKTLEEACDEYVQYCQHKQREVDKQFIERFDPRTLKDSSPNTAHYPIWLPNDCCELPSKLATATCSPPAVTVDGASPSTPALVSPQSRSSSSRPSILRSENGRTPFQPIPTPTPTPTSPPTSPPTPTAQPLEEVAAKDA